MWNTNNKFGSKKKQNKQKMDGYEFDSYPELERYVTLKMLQETKAIRDLEVHPKFILAKGQKNKFKQRVSQWAYTADFSYYDILEGYKVVEDVKSLRVDKKGKKHGTSQLRSYKLARNEFMRQNPDIYFKEIY